MSESDISLSDLSQKKPELSDLIKILRDEAQASSPSYSATVTYGLSDLTEAELDRLTPVWQGLPAPHKHHILKQLTESSEAVFDLDFAAFARRNLRDASSLVRAAAIELLWSDESVSTMRKLLELARDDDSPAVRAAAFSGLGRFILLGEYGEVPESDAREAQELSLRAFKNRQAPLELRRRALEALANSSHPEAATLIREAYADGNHLLKVSAIYAMGRTCDKIWRDIVLEELQNSDSQILYEAVQACGALQLNESVGAIGDLADCGDREIQLMAIWALGEIGGKRAFDILSDLEENQEDQELLEAIEAASDAASFSLSMASLDLAFDSDTAGAY